jgi:hypothetical protein
VSDTGGHRHPSSIAIINRRHRQTVAIVKPSPLFLADALTGESATVRSSQLLAAIISALADALTPESATVRRPPLFLAAIISALADALTPESATVAANYTALTPESATGHHYFYTGRCTYA